MVIHLPVMNERKGLCRSMLRILKINLMEKKEEVEILVLRRLIWEEKVRRKKR
jgi:hypothetical protein